MSEASTELTTVTTGQGEAAQEDTAQYLTFVLGDETYGVDILRVQEIKGWSPVTRIPNAPEYLRGVLNLRGAIVPIIDLRMRFHLETAEYTPTTVVIVLCIQHENRSRILGVVVDGVSDVLNVGRDDVKPTPDFGAIVNTEFIDGLATVDDQMVMLLDIDRLLSIDELAHLEELNED